MSPYSEVSEVSEIFRRRGVLLAESELASADVLFTRDDIEGGLRTLADELAAVGATSRIQVVGGAAIILRVERGVLTSDVDTLHCSTSGVQLAVERVAQAKRWPATRFNDAAQMWASHYDTDDDWESRFSSRGVSVLVARTPCGWR